MQVYILSLKYSMGTNVSVQVGCWESGYHKPFMRVRLDTWSQAIKGGVLLSHASVSAMRHNMLGRHRMAA